MIVAPKEKCPSFNFIVQLLKEIALREKCPNTEFFWSVFSHIWTEYGYTP